MRIRRALLSLAALTALLPIISLTQAMAQDRADAPPRPEDLDPEIGAASIPDRATYEKMSHKGDAGRDAYLDDIQFVKFQIEHIGSDQATLYFINTRNFRSHPSFMREIGTMRTRPMSDDSGVTSSR